jgi:type I restriction enzyme S subunit
MAGEWEETTVGDLVARGILERPLDGNHGSIHPRGQDFVASGVPFIMASDLVGGGIDTVNCSFITMEQAKSLRKGFAKRGDVLLSHKATLGRTAIVGEIPGDFVMLTPQVTYYRAVDPTRLSNRYLKYYFDSDFFQQVLRSWAGAGSTRAYIGITDQLRLPVLLPPLPEQRAIAHILGTLDDKIELNRRMNETLEAMARALFKSWFADFDPVRAKAGGRDPGLPKPLTDLFPDSFEDSELGEIPKGWVALPLYEVATYINGAAYAAFQPNDERRGLPIVKIAELKAGVTPQTRFSDVQMPEKYRIARGDILFSWSGNPDTSIDTFVWSHDPAWLNQHIFRVMPHHQGERAFVLSTLKHLKSVFAETARNKQTTGLGHVTAADMKRLMVARPDDRLVRAWSVIATPLLDRVLQNEVEIHSLSTLRDALLPKLISGELRVDEAARIAEAAK